MILQCQAGNSGGEELACLLQQSRRDAKKQQLLQNAEMSTLRGAKEGIWVMGGFLVVLFTEIANKKWDRCKGGRLRLHIGGVCQAPGVSVWGEAENYGSKVWVWGFSRAVEALHEGSCGAGRQRERPSAVQAVAGGEKPR